MIEYLEAYKDNKRKLRMMDAHLNLVEFWSESFLVFGRQNRFWQQIIEYVSKDRSLRAEI